MQRGSCGRGVRRGDGVKAGAGKRLRLDQPMRHIRQRQQHAMPARTWRSARCEERACGRCIVVSGMTCVRGRWLAWSRDRGPVSRESGAGSATTATTHRAHAMRGAGDPAVALDSHDERMFLWKRRRRVGEAAVWTSISASRRSDVNRQEANAFVAASVHRVQVAPPQGSRGGVRRIVAGCCGRPWGVDGGIGRQPLTLGACLRTRPWPTTCLPSPVTC